MNLIFFFKFIKSGFSIYDYECINTISSEDDEDRKIQYKISPGRE